ncbi:M50 family metallopeptidase [Alkalilimnicola ehrlichii MLHE-1]|nr:site-2 protease family protein [Alkalilimnicola ehrlichii]
MFKSVLVLGYYRGIRLEVHVSWLVIFALLLVTMSAGFHHHYDHWPLPVAILTALFTSLTFFASIVAHELGHSLVAIRRGVPVKAITLFIFGGVAQMSRDADSPDDEFWIAIAGPAVSFALALLFAALAQITAGIFEPLTVALGWLAVINLVVAVFNLIPGFPLDGGRVFRAAVWKFTGSARKGIEAAVAGGRLVAYGLFALALWNILVLGNLIGGLWITLIAWFLFNMAQAQGRMFDLRERLSGVRARDLARPDIPQVEPGTAVSDWVHHQVLPGGQRAHIVGNREHAHGLVSLSDARAVPQAQWATTRVDDIMTPAEALVSATPETDAAQVLQLITEHNLNQLPVMEGRRVLGWIDRHQLLHTIDLHMELRRPE